MNTINRIGRILRVKLFSNINSSAEHPKEKLCDLSYLFIFICQDEGIRSTKTYAEAYELFRDDINNFIDLDIHIDYHHIKHILVHKSLIIDVGERYGNIHSACDVIRKAFQKEYHRIPFSMEYTTSGNPVHFLHTQKQNYFLSCKH